MVPSVSLQTLQRLPNYLAYLKSFPSRECLHVSAKAIAQALKLGEIQVRKDLAAVSSKGRPRVGYVRQELIEDLEEYLGYNNTRNAVLVGAGKLGRALLSYEGFQKYGLNIVAGFDVKGLPPSGQATGKPILPLEQLEELCRRIKIQIGIITVPERDAQQVCDILVGSGIPAIWNFASVHLDVPEHILVKSENMASSLAVLSKHLTEKIYDEL